MTTILKMLPTIEIALMLILPFAVIQIQNKPSKTKQHKANKSFLIVHLPFGILTAILEFIAIMSTKNMLNLAIGSVIFGIVGILEPLYEYGKRLYVQDTTHYHGFI